MSASGAPASARVHAFTDDALGELDALGVAEAIRLGRVSRAEVVEAAIARVQKVDGELGAVAFEAYDAARVQAGQGGSGFFAGVPTFVKDNADVAGMPTQQGSSAYVGRPRPADGDWARTFLALGQVNLGKTQLSEFGFSASAEFTDREPVRNPWGTAYTSGASSAGSAALVAAGAVPFAHANDGGGSIRIPASCCGLVGLKPSRGRTLSDKTMRQMPVGIISDGVVTRSVRDTAAFLREYERVHRNVKMRPIGDVRGPGRKRRRIGLVLHSPFQQTDPETLAVVTATAELLESLGHHVEEVQAPVPAGFEDDFLRYWALLALVLTSTGKRNLDPGFDLARCDNLTRGLVRKARRELHRMPASILRLRGSQRAGEAFFTDHDLVLTPTLARVTPEIGWLDPGQSYETIIERLMQWVAFTPLQNAIGQPAIALPGGLDSRGMPVGIQIGTKLGAESRLLEVAFELEQARPFPAILG